MKQIKSAPPHAPQARGHQLRLAEGSLAAVDRCECGTLHVHVGAVTLRLHADALTELIGTLGHALVELRQREASQPRVFGAQRNVC